MQALTRKQQTLATRERLKASGTKAVAFHGVQGARIDQVVRGAGLTKGAFYAHFDDKLSMTLEILRDRHAVDIAYWEGLLDAATDAEGCIDDLIRRSGDSAQVNGLIGLELHLEAERNPVFRPHFTAYLEELHAKVGRLLCKILEKHGKAPPDNLPAVVAEIYVLGSAAGIPSFFASGMNSTALTGQFIRSRVNDLIQNARPLHGGT